MRKEKEKVRGMALYTISIFAEGRSSKAVNRKEQLDLDTQTVPRTQ